MNLTTEQKTTLYTNMVRIRKADGFVIKSFHEGSLAPPGAFHSVVNLILNHYHIIQHC